MTTASGDFNMSYSQFGYTYSSGVASTLPSQLLIPGSSITSSLGTPTTSCDTTPPPPSGGTSQQNNMYSTSAGLLSYPRVAGLADTVYSSAYATQGYVPFGADPSAFYSPLNTESTDAAWRSLSGTTGWPYDPNSMAGYPYGTSYGGLDVRRKNATRESTSTLKAWLYEHIKNPYPTKGEKIMLAIITKMTLTQVSTWFANARRRLKKENKMQWSPRNRSGDDDDHKSDDDNDDCAEVGAGGDGIHDSLRDNHQPINNNNSKSLHDGGDVTNEDDLSQVTTNFNSFMHSDSSHKDILGGIHGQQHTSRVQSLLDNGQDAFGNLRRDPEQGPLRLRREDDEDIIVDGGESDPLSRLDFPDHGLSHSRLKADPDLHPVHKLDNFDNSPLSQLSTPLGSPSHSMGESLLSPLGVKHNANNHCSNGNDVTHQHGDMSPVKVTPDMTLGGEGTKPRIWSLADVATSITPPSGRRSPGLSINSSAHGLGISSLSQHAAAGQVGGLSAVNKHAGLTAFSTPVSSQGHNSSFQPWVNGASYAVTGSTGHNPGLSYNYPVNPHPSMATPANNQINVPAPQRADLSTHSLGGLGGLANNSPYANKLHTGYHGDKSNLAQFSSGFSSGPEVLQTAFKPVAKRL